MQLQTHEQSRVLDEQVGPINFWADEDRARLKVFNPEEMTVHTHIQKEQATT